MQNMHPMRAEAILGNNYPKPFIIYFFRVFPCFVVGLGNVGVDADVLGFELHLCSPVADVHRDQYAFAESTKLATKISVIGNS